MKEFILFARIDQRYEGKTAAVIGAGGIGSSIARLLVSRVATLVVADFNESLLTTLATSLKTERLIAKKLDVRDASAVTRFFDDIQTTIGTPDYLFYAAGVLTIESFKETTSDLWDRAVDINLNGAFYCIKTAAELMRVQQRGSIVVLGSIAGTKARSGSRVNPVYNATKAGLGALINSAAIQFRADGIRINCVSPGPTDTSMMTAQPAQVHAAVSQITLDGRMNDPTEVAEVALFVAAHGRFTGEEICLGGGAGLGG